MAKESQTPAAFLAQNLQFLRKKRGLSQGQLATLTGLPRSTLTYLESGEGNPSLQNLTKLSSGLNVSLEELLRRPVIQTKHLRSDQIPRLNKSGGGAAIWKLLPDPITGFDMDRLEVKAGCRLGGVPHLPQTKEYLVLIRGQMEVSVEGQLFALKEGDVLSFHGDQKHSYFNPGRTLAEAISVVAFAAPSGVY